MSIPRLSEKETQVNVSNSILKFFGVAPLHDTYEPLDEVLEEYRKRCAKSGKDPKVCLFLMDGMGAYVQRKFKDFCPFVYEHQRFGVRTVYPPTTVAATTAILSGKYPKETGWLGWTQYFKKSNLYVQMFSGVLEGTNVVPDGPKPDEILPYKTIFEMIDEVNGQNSGRMVTCVRHHKDNLSADPKDRAAEEAISIFDESGNPSAGGLFELTELVLRESNTKFVYSYYNEPDHTLHAEGFHSENVRKKITVIDQCIKAISERNPDVLFLVIADHGHTPISFVDIRDYPDFCETLAESTEPRFSIESRFATFFVKSDRFEDFEKAYHKHFESDFEMYTREQIGREHVFGWGTPNPLYEEFVGDYTLIATGDKALWDGFNYNGMISTHAGATDRETELNLAVING